MPYVRKPSRRAIHAAEAAAEEQMRGQHVRALQHRAAILERQLAAAKKLEPAPKPVHPPGTQAFNLIVSVVLNPDRTVRGLSVRPA